MNSTTTIQLGFIKFDYNASHEGPLRSHTAVLGINYEVIAGVSHPDTPDLPCANSGHRARLIDGCASSPAPDAASNANTLSVNHKTKPVQLL